MIINIIVSCEKEDIEGMMLKCLNVLHKSDQHDMNATFLKL